VAGAADAVALAVLVAALGEASRASISAAVAAAGVDAWLKAGKARRVKKSLRKLFTTGHRRTDRVSQLGKLDGILEKLPLEKKAKIVT
jgi:hypothetical protein